MLLRYDTPANHFCDALPIGNGRLGAMVHGLTNRERITLNEDSCWAGGVLDRLNPRRAGALARVRELLFAGRYAEADAMARQDMLATPLTIDSSQPMGELDLRIGWRAECTDYRRWLDLDGAIAVCEWREKDFHHRRTVFASAPDQVLVVHHEILSGDPLTPMAARLHREGPSDGGRSVEGELLLTGHAHAHAARYDSNSPKNPSTGLGMPLAVRLRALIDGGKAAPIDDRLQVTGSRRTMFLIGMATGFREQDSVAATKAVLDAAASFSFEELLARHQADHRALFRRFHIDLGGALDDGRSLSARFASLRAGADDPGLMALSIQAQRYLLIAASRPGSLPSTSQGIWSEQQQNPWNGDYHFNINLQMNYWLAEPTNLGECFEPVLAWTESIIPRGERTARELYGCRGWTLHHLSDPFGTTEPCDGIWGLWPWGGVWLCLNFHDRWSYTRDPAILARVWPLLRGAVRFVLDFLIEGPAGTAHAGLLTTCPSHSPENDFLTPEGKRGLFTYGATMDIGLCRALFKACLEQIDAVGGEDALRAEIESASHRLPPLKISARTGGIQEWAEDYEERDPGHRHISHLFDVHPGVGISPRRTPELAEAARATLRRKAAHQANNTHGRPGWTLNWLASHWTRLGDADQAHALLQSLLKETTALNFMTIAHEQPQAHDACGSSAVVCEMLVQSHEGIVRLLPALPSAWPRGRVIGLLLHGALSLDLTWENSRVAGAVFTALRSTTLRLEAVAELKPRHSSRQANLSEYGWTIPLAAGETVTFEPEASPVAQH